ncbi:MAG: hypothetical protein ACQEQV_09745 [Fibrobacterota bacterium]
MIKRTIIIAAAAGAAVILFFVIRGIRQEKGAQEIVHRATSLINKAAADTQDYTKTLTLYNRALSELELLKKEKYNGTETAENVFSGNRKISGYTITELRSQILPEIKRKAKAEEDLFSLLLLLLDETEPPYYRALFNIFIAQAYSYRNETAGAAEFMQQAGTLVDSLDAAYLKIDILTSTAPILHDLGDSAQARQDLQRARLLLPAIAKTPLRDRMSLSLISACAACRMFEAGERIMENIESEYIQQAGAFALVREVEQSYSGINYAIEIADAHIHDPYLRARAMLHITTRLHSAGKTNQALHFFRQYRRRKREIRRPAREFEIILEENAAAAHLQELSFSELTDERTEFFSQIKDADAQIRLLLLWAEKLDDFGQKELADAKFAMALDQAEILVESRNTALHRIGSTLARTKRFEEALHTALKITDPLIQKRTVAEIALEQIKQARKVTSRTSTLLNRIINQL